MHWKRDSLFSWSVGFVWLLLCACAGSGAISQEIYSGPYLPFQPAVAESADTQQVLPPRVAGKASLPSVERSTGQTYVTLASGLRSVVDEGREPRTKQELKALELQQSLVAKAIEKVTVNVQQGAAQGSGVIISEDGYVLTAAHVAGHKGREAYVYLSNGTQVRARTLGMNRDKDAGLLKIEDSRYRNAWPHATIGHSSALKEGDWCIASGHPGGWKPERGAVIRVGRILKISKDPTEVDAHTLFTDCTLIGGDSGGPLFTLKGELIGIHSRIGTDFLDNMHVPIDVFSTNWARMQRGEVWGTLPGYRPVIGVRGTKDNDRPLIAEIIGSSPAEEAGLQVGDLILTFDGQPLETFADLKRSVEGCLPGDVVKLTLLRNGQTIRASLVVGLAD